MRTWYLTAALAAAAGLGVAACGTGTDEDAFGEAGREALVQPAGSDLYAEPDYGAMQSPVVWEPRDDAEAATNPDVEPDAPADEPEEADPANEAATTAEEEEAAAPIGG